MPYKKKGRFARSAGAALIGGRRSMGEDDFLTAAQNVPGAAEVVLTGACTTSFYDPSALAQGLYRCSRDMGRKMDPEVEQWMDENSILQLNKPAALWGEVNVLRKTMLGYGFSPEKITAFMLNALFDHFSEIDRTDPAICRQYAVAHRAWYQNVARKQAQSGTGLSARQLFTVARLASGDNPDQVAAMPPNDAINDGGKGGITGWVRSAARTAGNVATDLGGVEIKTPVGSVTIGSKREVPASPQQSLPGTGSSNPFP